MNIGKIFVEGLVREVGRSGGRVISNKIYGNAHSMPVRVIQEMESGTQPLYSGTRRKYRHSLDRIINGDLPSSKAKAKKQLVVLEDALDEFISSNTSAPTILSWLLATDNYIEKVERVNSDLEVQEFAEVAKDNVAEIRGEVIQALIELPYPNIPEPISSLNKSILNIGFLLVITPFVALLIGAAINRYNAIPDGFGIVYLVVLLAGFICIAIGNGARSRHKRQMKIYDLKYKQVDLLKELIPEDLRSSFDNQADNQQ